MYEGRVTRMLTTQYRMNASIMDWASQALYEGQLRAHESVKDHLLCHIEGVESNEDTGDIIIIIIKYYGEKIYHDLSRRDIVS